MEKRKIDLWKEEELNVQQRNLWEIVKILRSFPETLSPYCLAGGSAIEDKDGKTCFYVNYGRAEAETIEDLPGNASDVVEHTDGTVSYRTPELYLEVYPLYFVKGREHQVINFLWEKLPKEMKERIEDLISYYTIYQDEIDEMIGDLERKQNH